MGDILITVEMAEANPAAGESSFPGFTTLLRIVGGNCRRPAIPFLQITGSLPDGPPDTIIHMPIPDTDRTRKWTHTGSIGPEDLEAAAQGGVCLLRDLEALPAKKLAVFLRTGGNQKVRDEIGFSTPTSAVRVEAMPPRELAVATFAVAGTILLDPIQQG